ncbi:SusE domain-containing protein [Mucilaginibacter sp.]
MKKLATRFLAFSSIGLLMMMSSCKKNDKMVTDAGTTSSTLSASSTTLVLDRTRVNDTTAAVTFTFTAPHYTFKSAGTNEIQVDVPGDNWKNAATYQITGNNLKQAFSTVVFDNLVLKLNLPAGASFAC